MGGWGGGVFLCLFKRTEFPNKNIMNCHKFCQLLFNQLKSMHTFLTSILDMQKTLTNTSTNNKCRDVYPGGLGKEEKKWSTTQRLISRMVTIH